MTNDKELEDIVASLDKESAKKFLELQKSGMLDIFLKGAANIEEMRKKNPVDASVYQTLLEAFMERKAISNHTVAYLLSMEVELVDESLERLSQQGMSKLVIEHNSSFYTFVPDKG
jgi:hypothetical protein